MSLEQCNLLNLTILNVGSKSKLHSFQDLLLQIVNVLHITTKHFPKFLNLFLNVIAGMKKYENLQMYCSEV